jgi:LemA protein
MAMQATGPADKAVAENQLTGALKSLFAVAENYPQLQASQEFTQLQNLSARPKMRFRTPAATTTPWCAT